MKDGETTMFILHPSVFILGHCGELWTSRTLPEKISDLCMTRLWSYERLCRVESSNR